MAFSWDVTLGHLLVAIPLTFGATAYLVTDHNAVASIQSNISDLKASMKDQFASITTAIGNLPDVQAQSKQVERRVNDLESFKRETDVKVVDFLLRLGNVEFVQKQGLRQPK